MKVSTKLKAIFSRLLVLTAFVCFGFSAKADEIVWTELQLGTEYTVVDFKSFYGKFTAPKTGVVTASYTTGAGAPRPYLDEALEQSVSVNSTTMGYDFYATQGVTYYIAENFVFQGGVLTLSMADNLELVETSPVAGSTLDLGGGAIIDLLFNMNVTVSGGAVISGSNKASLGQNVLGASVTAELRTTLYEWLSTGKVKAGDVVTIQLNGVAAASDPTIIYGEDGSLSLDFICPELPVSLVEEKTISKFYSYWMPGDESAVMTLTFSGDLDPTSAVVTFGYGNAEASNPKEYYTEDIPYTINGNVMTIDFSGTVRDPEAMVVSGTHYSQVSLSITNVRSADGQYVYTPYQGSLGSFSYYISFYEAAGTYRYAFEPEAGADLADVKNLELWIRGNDQLKYEGLQIAYTDAYGRHTVALTEGTDYTAEFEGTDEVTYTVPVKEEWKTASDVVLSLRNFVSIDGKTLSIEAKYNAFVVTGINPEAGAVLGYLDPTTTVVVTTNRSKSITNFLYEIHDLNAESADDYVIKSMSYLTPDADSVQWSGEVYGSHTFYTGHKYSFVFKAYNTQSIAGTPMAIDSIVVSGGTQPYEYSDTQLSSIVPADGSTITDASQNCFTITFDGLVSLPAAYNYINVGQGITQKFDSIVNVVDDASVSYKWSVYVSPEYLQQHPGQLSLTIVAVDLSGKRVQGNMGVDEGTYFNFTYTNAIGVPEVTCIYPTAGVSAESVEYLLLQCEDGIAESYNGTKIYVMNALTGTVAATVTSLEPVYTSDNYDDPATMMFVYLDKTITEGGRYYLTFPEGYFYLGANANYNSQELTVGFVVEPKTTTVATTNVEATPANGSTVVALNTVILTFSDYEEVGEEYNCSEAITVTDAAGSVVTTGTVEMDWSLAYNQLVLNLAQEITADGVYTINFPEGKFIVGSYYDEWSTAFSLTYYIGAQNNESNTTAVVADPANGSTVTSLKTIGLTFTDEDFAGEEWNCTKAATVTDANGNIVATLSFSYGVEYNQLVAELSQEITADGVYTVNFPAGKFTFGENGDSWSTEFTLTYTIVSGNGGAEDNTTPVSADPANGSVVTSLKNIELTFTAEEYASEEWNCTEPATVTDAAGNVVATISFSFGVGYNQLIAELSQEITADGVYTVNFPAGKFTFGEWGNTWSTAITLTYYIGVDPAGINGIAADRAAAYRVYNLQGACILRTSDAAAVKALPAGIYVVNGVKTVVR